MLEKFRGEANQGDQKRESAISIKGLLVEKGRPLESKEAVDGINVYSQRTSLMYKDTLYTGSDTYVSTGPNNVMAYYDTRFYMPSIKSVSKEVKEILDNTHITEGGAFADKDGQLVKIPGARISDDYLSRPRGTHVSGRPVYQVGKNAFAVYEMGADYGKALSREDLTPEEKKVFEKEIYFLEGKTREKESYELLGNIVILEKGGLQREDFEWLSNFVRETNSFSNYYSSENTIFADGYMSGSGDIPFEIVNINWEKLHSHPEYWQVVEEKLSAMLQANAIRRKR